MVNVEFVPDKKVVVHQVYRFGSKEELAKRIVGFGQNKPVFWCDGVLFVYFTNNTDLDREEYFKGTWHWDALLYADMPKYSESVELEDGSYKGVKLMVLDYSGFDVFKDVMKWLRSRKA